MQDQSKLKQFFVSMFLVSVLTPGLAIAEGSGKTKGLSADAMQELRDAGMDKYLGEFTPSSSEEIGDGWTRHTFDTADGDGPICIDGSPYSVYTRNSKGKSNKEEPNELLIMLQGGGACWQFVSQCTQSVAGQEPPFARSGIWDFDNKDNPFDKHAVVYLPYCDGSVFVGDNALADPFFNLGDPGYDGERKHRGLRNLSAGLDVARATFDKPAKITVAGTSAGGVGSVSFTPFLVRMLYGNKLQSLTVFNDAGPLAFNPAAPAAAQFREIDWQFSQFFPASCSDCGVFGNQTAIVQWRLDNDSTIREAQYQTDADQTNIGFSSINAPGTPFIAPEPFGLSQNQFRDLTLDASDPVNESHPNRYKRFIVSGDRSHTALQTPRFYTQDANGVVLNEWTADFLKDRQDWMDIVEDFIAAP